MCKRLCEPRKGALDAVRLLTRRNGRVSVMSAYDAVIVPAYVRAWVGEVEKRLGE